MLTRDDDLCTTIGGLKPNTSYTFTIKAENAVGASTAATSSTVTLTTPTLSDVFDNIGTSNDTATNAANIDGAGSSLSAQALAAVSPKPATPGAQITSGGLTFTWPSTAVGQPDNTVASGQSITVPGTGTTLGFLATGTYGQAGGTGTITYTDGTTQTYTLTAPDWYATPPAGTTPALTTTYRNRPGNTRDTHPITVYYTGITLQSGKTVATVTLPNTSGAPQPGTPSLHIFATTIG